MKRYVIALLFVLLAAVAFAQGRRYEALTVDGTAGGVAISAAIVGGTNGVPQSNYCEGRLETAQVRFTDDGTAPTASVGTVLEVGDVWIGYSHDAIRAARFIRTGSTSGSLKVRCYERAPRVAE